jgi:S-adenosylmethionine hydrolase
MGTAKMPQFQLNSTGMYSFVVLSSDSNVLITSIYVLPGHLEKMHFKETPTNAVSERPIPVIEILLFDMFGNLLVNTSQSVILRLVDRPFNSLQGNLMVFSLNGIATFHDISIGNARVDHRLVATSSNLSFSSETFDVKPGDIFVLKIAETVSSVALSQYSSSGFFQSEIFNVRVEALDHFGNFITNANMTMSPREVKQISAIGLKWRMTSSNGSAVFSLALSDENSYSDPDLSFMPQFVFSSQNISVTSNPTCFRAFDIAFASSRALFSTRPFCIASIQIRNCILDSFTFDHILLRQGKSRVIIDEF